MIDQNDGPWRSNGLNRTGIINTISYDFNKLRFLDKPHADIIVKDRRETYYGHKICLSGGASNFIINCLIVDGNPADSDLTDQMLDRHQEIYRYYPLKVALDGGFASKTNLQSAKDKGIKDVCFTKKRGLEEEHMCPQYMGVQTAS